MLVLHQQYISHNRIALSMMYAVRLFFAGSLRPTTSIPLLPPKLNEVALSNLI
ncbi:MULTISPECIES: hypothetical protein [unclassified Lactobacillus]|uniref:hypothetical protein n=1 Tax=unclassified Lactobacillus TaxID=2620435 RepID=UPI001314B9C0|nr:MULTISPECIES: hypothetical protein [unclassified Lactobacillus]